MATTSVPHQWTYDVFVSFRGEDIRKNFVDHLFKEFWRTGINAFKDDTRVPVGQYISPELNKAIEESRFLLVIFSKDYASSSWCLRELTKILECKKMKEPKYEVRMIFYDVKPDVVRKQKRSYAEAFVEHEVSNITEVAKWKESLREAASISGVDLQDKTNGYEAELIDVITKEILENLFKIRPLDVDKNLVGVDARVEEMNLLRYVGSSKVHMIGICGISEIGKTTLAKAIYNILCIHFKECSFCEDVQGVTKRGGLTQVQRLLIDPIVKDQMIANVNDGIMLIKQRMGSKPILLVLDNVDNHDQLEALAGSRTWFCPGSLIIFTCKSKQLLKSHKVYPIHDMSFLQHDEALELFSLYAFDQKHPVQDFIKLANQVVGYLQGHPLALKLLGLCLNGEPMCRWKSEVDGLQKFPNIEIQDILRPTYHGLGCDERKIFLDIACSFIGENKDFVVSVLESCTSSAYANMQRLVDKSLVTISRDNSIQMHDLIQGMARGILHEEQEEKKVRSRLLTLSEHCNVWSKNKATRAEAEAIEVLDLLLEASSQKVHIDGEAFEDMKNLRILKICDGELKNYWEPFEPRLWKDSKVNYSGRLKFLSNKLVLLYWHGFRFELPSDFYPENIVAIDLSYSHIKDLWTTPKCFGRLKVMKLKHCHNLTRTPDFTKITNLEELILEGCVNLVNVHPSIGMLNKLVVLNMRNCERFKGFPSKVQMGSLEVLNLSGCSRLKKFPDFSCTVITELPSIVSSQNNLQVLNIGRHERIWSRWRRTLIPQKHPQSLVTSSLAGLCSLRELVCSNCNISEVPDSIGGLSCLESLDLCGNDFTNLPGCLSQLSRLQTLELSGCKKLEVLPKLPHSIYYLDTSHCTSLQELQGPLSHFPGYTYFNFMGCPKLFWSLTGERKVSMLQPQPLDSSVSSHGSINEFSSYLRYMNMPSIIRGIFQLPHERSYGGDHVDLIFRGNRNIPQWFTKRSMESDVKMELPPDWCYNKFRGFGTYVVFTPTKQPYELNAWAIIRLKNFDGAPLQDFGFPLHTSMDMNYYESDFTLFNFRPKFWVWEKVKDFVTVSFEGDDVVVKECGVRLVYDEDIQEEESFGWITQYLPTSAQSEGTMRLHVDNTYMTMCW